MGLEFRLPIYQSLICANWNCNRGWHSCGEPIVETRRGVSCRNGINRRDSCSVVVSWGVKEDVLIRRVVDRNEDGLARNLMLTENGEYDYLPLGELGLTSVWLPADNVEDFLLLCTEYCGITTHTWWL